MSAQQPSLHNINTFYIFAGFKLGWHQPGPGLQWQQGIRAGEALDAMPAGCHGLTDDHAADVQTHQNLMCMQPHSVLT
jgi:hypothetical protein